MSFPTPTQDGLDAERERLVRAHSRSGGIAVAPSMTALVQWLDADESRAIYNNQRTPSVSSGDVGAARIVPGLALPDDCPVELFPQLSQAMAAYPDLPWHELSVWSGTDPEPELVEVQEAHRAAQEPQP